MCARSANFNSAVFLAACSLLTVDSSSDIANDGPLPVLREDPRCSPLLSVVLSVENINDSTLLTASQTLEKNGSLLYDGIVYPTDLHWTDGNVTYGCICKLRDCIRKCCRGDEVLRKDLTKTVCQKIFHNDTMPAREIEDLRLSRKQMAEEVQHVGKLKDHFLLLENFVCPAGIYALDPDEFQEEKFILQADGSLVNAYEIIPLWNYCIDWQMNFDRISILVCLTPQMPNEEELMAHVEFLLNVVCIAVSILFLVATFLVYAIIPELKNLYGKTLMYYVICLIISYVFLLLVNYIYMSSHTLCIITGKQPPCRWSNSFAI
ncbi:G-protein coupled receptor Mth [Formica fusca]